MNNVLFCADTGIALFSIKYYNYGYKLLIFCSESFLKNDQFNLINFFVLLVLINVSSFHIFLVERNFWSSSHYSIVDLVR